MPRTDLHGGGLDEGKALAENIAEWPLVEQNACQAEGLVDDRLQQVRDGQVDDKATDDAVQALVGGDDVAHHQVAHQRHHEDEAEGDDGGGVADRMLACVRLVEGGRQIGQRGAVHGVEQQHQLPRGQVITVANRLVAFFDIKHLESFHHH